MKKIKFLGLAALGSATILGLASCGGNNGTTTTATPQTTTAPAAQTTTEPAVATTTAQDTNKKVLTFYNTCGDSLQNVIKTAVATFEAKYPGWTVNPTQVSNGYDGVYSTITADLGAGTTPDMAYCYSDHVASYLSSGKVLDLTTFINSTKTVKTAAGTDVAVGYTAAEKADFIDAYYQEGLATTYADYDTYGYSATSMLTLPYSKSTEALYYNNSVLNELDIDVPETWDEVWDACAIIKENYPNCTPLCYDSEANWFITMCEQNGWGYTSANGENRYLFNGTNQQNFLTELQSYYNLGYISTQTTYGSYTSALFTAGADTGCVFCIGSSAGATYQDPKGKFDWGVAPIPGSELADGTVSHKQISQGPSIVLFDNGDEERQLMTWMFLKEILEPAFQAKFSMTSGYCPVRKSSYEIADFADFLDNDELLQPAVIKMTQELANNNGFFVSPAFPGSAVCRQQVGTALVYVIKGEKTAERALSDARRNIV